MKDTFLKDYKTNEGIYVIHNTMDALYQKFCGCIPKELEKKIVDLITETLNMIVDKTEIEGYKIIDENYIWRVKYKKETD